MVWVNMCVRGSVYMLVCVCVCGLSVTIGLTIPSLAKPHRNKHTDDLLQQVLLTSCGV